MLQLLDVGLRFDSGTQARIVRDQAILHRHVEVDPDQRDLAGEIACVSDAFEVMHVGLPD